MKTYIVREVPVFPWEVVNTIEIERLKEIAASKHRLRRVVLMEEPGTPIQDQVK